MTREEYLEFCRGIPGAIVDQPFEEGFDTWIARHADSRKWFAAILEHEGRQFVNLKCDPIEAEFLREVYLGVERGYHMNKTHWISVIFQSDVPDELFKTLTQKSWQLTEKQKRTKKESEIEG